MKKILVIDDSPMIRHLVRSSIKSQECECDEAENGREAFHKIEHEKYDLIITDVNMPVLSGLELLGEIRTKLPEVKTPILILTSEAELQSVKIAKGYGVAAWIVKPFTTDILIKTVSRLLNGNSNEK